MKSFRNIRVIPVVVIAVFCLAVLKVAGLVLDGGYVFDYNPQSSGPSWAQQNLNFPGGPKPVVASKDLGDVTGSVDSDKDKAKPAEASKEEKTQPDGVLLHPEENQQPISDSERAILERLQSRRQELDTRAREIDIRESLLKEAEKRIETKVEGMKATEARTQADTAAKAEAQNAKLKGLVATYEGMKPKDAAKVFDKLEMPVLIEIASQIKPRNMSDILGLMQTDAAERLTVELARRANGDGSGGGSADLPKIEGKVIPQK